MEIQLAYIEKQQKQLNDTQFCSWLRAVDSNTTDKVAFVPAMAFFVLGFRDILRHIEYKNPTNDIEKMINQHCMEDSFHWKWFLSDLEKLGFNLYSWGNSIVDVFGQVWSDEQEATRDMVYETIHLVKKSNNPKLTLVIIEVLEAAFGVFIKNMTCQLESSPVYGELQYFGKLHLEHEESHSMGHWGDGCQLEDDINKIELSSEEQLRANVLIEQLFGQFHTVFENWYNSRERFYRMNRTTSAGERTIEL